MDEIIEEIINEITGEMVLPSSQDNRSYNEGLERAVEAVERVAKKHSRP